ncbi:MAG TPA: type II toxin-antitoxin system VapC family toxin [Streptosporangiaceae bacterium]|nr:type II toxin-antitoxin system VapC family toxin [Streptosporangiaceae bacterium]
MSYLLDTNVISELRKRTPNHAVTTWFDATPSSGLFLSCLTIGEIRCCIERLRRKDDAQALAIEHWLTGLRTIYRDRITAIDADITEVWGRLNVTQQLPVVDGLLAATALSRDWTLVTRNTADFAHCGVCLLNPWDGATAR